MTGARRKVYAEQRFDHLEGLDGISDEQIALFRNIKEAIVERRLVEPMAIRPAAAA